MDKTEPTSPLIIMPTNKVKMQLELGLEYPETPEEVKQKKWRYDAKVRLPVYTPLYKKQFNLFARCYRLDQDFNCHTFIQKKNLKTGKYIGGWLDYD